METLAHITFYLGVIAYSVGGTLYFLELSRRPLGKVGASWAPGALVLGAAAHTTHVIAASLLSNICPVSSRHFALSMAALLAVLTFLAFGQQRRLRALGVVVTPLALTFLVGAQFVANERPSLPISPGLLALHVTANLLGVGLFLLAGAASGFYLAQERRLRSKRAGLPKVPALDVLDRNGHGLLLAGFPLLTLGVVTGAMFNQQLGGVSGLELVRVGLGYGTWVLVAIVLSLRALAGWRGKKAAYGTILGAVCILLVILLYALRPFTEAVL